MKLDIKSVSLHIYQFLILVTQENIHIQPLNNKCNTLITLTFDLAT